MPKLVFWTGAKPSSIKKTIGVTLSRMATKPLHKFVTMGEERYVAQPDEVVLAMGKTALELLAKDGVVPKGRSIDSLQGKVWQKPDEGAYMLGFDPGMVEVDPGLESEVIWQVQLAARFVQNGSLEAKLGEYKWVEDFSEIIARIEASYEATGKPVAVAADIETWPKSPFASGAKIVAIGFTDREGFADLLYLGDLKTNEQARLVHSQIRWLLTTEKVKSRGANFKFDLSWIAVRWGIECTNFSMDTLLVGSLLDENRSNGLKSHVKIYCTDLGGYDDSLMKGDIEAMHLVPKSRMLNYLGGDVDGTLRVSNCMVKEIAEQPGLRRFYTKLLHPGAQGFQRLERQGVTISIPLFKKLQSDLETEIATLSAKGLSLLPARLRYKYADNLKLSRAAILEDYFFSPMGLNLKPKMTTAKSGKPSTAKNHLEMFADVPEAQAMCAVLDGLNSASKTLSTYAVGFLKHLRSDGKLHPNYFLHSGADDWGADDGGTVTGRLSAKEPAIQTVPKKTSWGKRIRECFTAPPGYVCLEVDFSQGELRLAACIAEEPNMIAAYKDGIDLHCKTGAGLIGMPLEEFMLLKESDPDQFKIVRTKAKPANFGIIYGISPDGYMAYAWNGYRVKIDLKEATETVDGFFQTYPELLNWHKRYKQMAKQDGFVVSPLGRIRHVPHIDSFASAVRAKAERQAINSPVQATLSDMMVWAIAEIDRQHPEYLPFAMIHDAGYWYVPEDRAEEAARNVTEIMGNLPIKQTFGWDHAIPFPADASLGPDLGHMKELH